MSKQKPPVTAAVRILRQHKAVFTDHLYHYEEKGGTAQAARELGIAEHCVIKTLIMEDEQRQPMIVLMHGNKQVSTKELARTLGIKSVTPCDPNIANRYSGYQVGGTSPFGTRKDMPIYMEASILDLPLIYMNGGKKGYMIGISPAEVQRILKPMLVKVALEAS